MSSHFEAHFSISITSILSKVRQSNTLFFAIDFAFTCHRLGALVRLFYLLWHSLGLPNNFLYFFLLINDCSSS